MNGTRRKEEEINNNNLRTVDFRTKSFHNSSKEENLNIIHSSKNIVGRMVGVTIGDQNAGDMHRVISKQQLFKINWEAVLKFAYDGVGREAVNMSIII
eukprot:754908-Ditylum_brightwellii.AAC.1